MFFRKKSELNESKTSKKTTNLFNELFFSEDEEQFKKNNKFVFSITSKEAFQLVDEVTQISYDGFIKRNNTYKHDLGSLKELFGAVILYGYRLFLSYEMVIRGNNFRPAEVTSYEALKSEWYKLGLEDRRTKFEILPTDLKVPYTRFCIISTKFLSNFKLRNNASTQMKEDLDNYNNDYVFLGCMIGLAEAKWRK